MKNNFSTTTAKSLFTTILPTLAALALLTGCGDSNPPFEGTLPLITLGGRSFTNIVFPYPRGTIHAH